MSDHELLMQAGWQYRQNGRGWIIYLDPLTNLWKTLAEAMEILPYRKPAVRTQ